MEKKQAAKATKVKGSGLLPGQDYLIMKDLTIVPFTGDLQNESVPAEAIGGFHTLCADVGDITGHHLSGFRAGDIVPTSLWNMVHRPACYDPRGFVYDRNSDLWVGIYLAQDENGLINLSFNDFVSEGQRNKCRLLADEEFASAAAGSNEMTNISDSSRPKRSGGHVDQLGRRMISNIGCEDCCGVLWQYLSTPHPVHSEWALLAGGSWGYGTDCGSRSRAANSARGSAYSYVGARFASEPLLKHAVR